MTTPKIGLALGSGAARGWSHIGVIRALEEMDIRPDIVTGSSAGAVVGAAYAAGRLDALEDWITRLDRAGVIRLLDTQLSGGGFIQGIALMHAIEKHIGNPAIEELDIAFGCVATQLGTGREIWIREGSLLNGIRASMAMPGVFAPVAQNGEYLLDGGLVNPVPVSLARAMGADVVIAVNLNGDLVGQEFFLHDIERKEHVETQSRELAMPFEDTDSFIERWTEKLKLSVALKLDSYISSKLSSNADGPGLFDIVVGAIDIMQDRITRARMAGEPPDVHIAPRLRHIGLMEFERAKESIIEGREAARRESAELLALKRALDRSSST